MNEFFEEEQALLKRYRGGDESALKLLIERYQQKVFALVLYSAGCNLDKAYEITVSSFVGAVRRIPSLSGKASFIRALICSAIQNVKGAKTILSPDEVDSSDSSAVKKEMHRVVKRSLLALPFDIKVILLLRDQINLPYEDISSTLELTEVNVKTKLAQGRAQLREKIVSMVGRP